MGRLRDQILTTLQERFRPTHLELIDESDMHSRATPENPETHFKLIIVSPAFAGLNAVKRQQAVYACLLPLFQQGLHALSQHVFTPEEWAHQPKVNVSPQCAGQHKHES